MNRSYNSSNAYKYDNHYMSQPARNMTRNEYGRMSDYSNEESFRYSKKAELERKRNLAYKKAQKIEKIVATSFRVVVIFSLCIFLVYRYVLITELKMVANDLKNEYNEIVNENQVIQNSIDSAIDLKNLQKIATTELGMVRPTADQIIQVENVNESYGEKVKNKSEKKLADEAEEETPLSGAPGSIIRFVTGK